MVGEFEEIEIDNSNPPRERRRGRRPNISKFFGEWLNAVGRHADERCEKRQEDIPFWMNQVSLPLYCNARQTIILFLAAEFVRLSSDHGAQKWLRRVDPLG